MSIKTKYETADGIQHDSEELAKQHQFALDERRHQEEIVDRIIDALSGGKGGDSECGSVRHELGRTIAILRENPHWIGKEGDTKFSMPEMDGEPWNLGQLIDGIHNALMEFAEENDGDSSSARIEFDFGNLVPTGISCYRGYYDRIAVNFETRSARQEDMKAEKFLQGLREMVDQKKEVRAYKGGEYVVRMDRELHVAYDYSETTETRIVGVRAFYGGVLILTQRQED